MPRKIRQLISDLEQAGFFPIQGGKGSHRKFRHPRFSGAVILSEASPPSHPHCNPMKPEDRYLKFVRWSDADRTYVGYCPDLFPWGGVCHGATEEVAYRKLRLLVREEVTQLSRKHQMLPPPSTRPMRDAVLA